MDLPSLRKDPVSLWAVEAIHSFPSSQEFLMYPVSLYQTLALSHLLNKHALVAIPLKNKTNPKQTKLSLVPTASAPNKCIFSFCGKTLQKSCPHSVSNLVLLLALQPL